MQKFEKELELINRIKKNLTDYKKLVQDLEITRNSVSWECSNNIPKKFLEVICEEYDFKELIIEDGYIFKIIKQPYKNIFYCKKIKFDLTLSEETYELEKLDEENSDGSYWFSHFYISELLVLE